MRLTDRLTRLERQTTIGRHITAEQVTRIVVGVAIDKLMDRSPDGLSEAERLALAREALPEGYGDPQRVARQWFKVYRLSRRCGNRP